MDRWLFAEDIMKCAICRNGYAKEGYTTVVLERDETTLVFKDVPAHICDNCGEEYLSSETNGRLLELAREALDRGVFLEMLRYAA